MRLFFVLLIYLEYDTVTEEFRLTTFTSLYSKRYTLDYTDKNRFVDNTFDQIDWECPELNIEALGGIPEIDISGKGDNNDGTGDNDGGDEIVDISPIYLPLNQSNCSKDNGYNSAEPSTNSEVLEHKQFDIGNYVIYGASKSSNKYYVNEAAGELSIQFKVNLDPSKLNGTTDVFIENDSSNSALNTSISQQIGKGAIWTRITFNDGSTQYISVKTDIFNGVNAGDYISIVSTQDLIGYNLNNISTIEIALVYEITEYLGWNLFDIGSYRYSNWRSDYVFEFTN